jgi:hypothetical protein
MPDTVETASVLNNQDASNSEDIPKIEEMLHLPETCLVLEIVNIQHWPSSAQTRIQFHIDPSR